MSTDTISIISTQVFKRTTKWKQLCYLVMEHNSTTKLLGHGAWLFNQATWSWSMTLQPSYLVMEHDSPSNLFGYWAWLSHEAIWSWSMTLPRSCLVMEHVSPLISSDRVMLLFLCDQTWKRVCSTYTSHCQQFWSLALFSMKNKELTSEKRLAF